MDCVRELSQPKRSTSTWTRRKVAVGKRLPVRAGPRTSGLGLAGAVMR